LATAYTEFSKLKMGGIPVYVVNGKYKVKLETVHRSEDAVKIIRALAYKE